MLLLRVNTIPPIASYHYLVRDTNSAYHITILEAALAEYTKHLHALYK